MIKLQSSNGEVFEVEVQVAKLSLYIKDMLDDLGVEDNEVIPIPQNAPNISGAILRKIIQYANHHKDDPSAAEDDDKLVKPTDDMSSWDAEFLQVDQSILFQLIRAANYLNIKSLLNVACKKVAKMIKGMKIAEVREMFPVQNNFTPNELEQVWREYEWCDVMDSEVNKGRFTNMFVMDKALTDSIQDVGNEGSSVIEDCLKNSEVVRKIFQHFSNSELFTLSTANKTWSYEARLLMRTRGNVVARLDCHKTNPCYQVFEAFGADLQQMNVVPYSGLTLVISPNSHAGGTAALDSTYEAIMARVPLKRLSIRLVGNWWKYKDFPAFLLLKKLLEDFSGVLEHLTLYIEKKRSAFIQHFIRDFSFPVLQILSLVDERHTQDELYTNYLKALVLRAPKLKELHVGGPMNLMENVLEGSEAVLVYQQIVRAPFDDISENTIQSLRLQKMDMFNIQRLYDPGFQFNFDRFSRIAPFLLQESCSKTLCELNVDAVLALPLMCYGICLESVKDLRISINYHKLELGLPQILRFVKDLDFLRIFPKVTNVSIIDCVDFDPLRSPAYMNTIMEQATAVLMEEPMPDRAVNIQELYLGQRSISISTVHFFAEMFPSIQKLRIDTTIAQENHTWLGSIWKHWVDLKEIKLTRAALGYAGNLDSVFCGIFPEEVAELNQKSDDFLERVNIVPVMPAITNLKNLRTLTLQRFIRQMDEPFLDDGAYMFSKVTGLIAFKRCPSLAVSLTFLCNGFIPAIPSYLQNFASVLCLNT